MPVVCRKSPNMTAKVTLVGHSPGRAPLTWLLQVRREELVHFIRPPLLGPLFGFVFQTLNHEVLQLNDTEAQVKSGPPGILLSRPPPASTHNAAKVTAHKDVVEGGQFQVGGPQVPGQLETFAVRDAAAPVRRAERTRAGRSFIWRHR